VGWIAHDSRSLCRLSCSFTEISLLASSYRAELLDLYSIHFFLQAVQTNLRCDNKVALRTLSKKGARVPQAAKCAYLLRTFKSLHQQTPLKIHYGHVKAHMDDILSWDDLSLEQQLNVECDRLAKQAVVDMTHWLIEYGYPDTEPQHQLLPGKICTIFVNGIKQTSDPGLAICLSCWTQIGGHRLGLTF
jgi:hypothetical protein